MSVIDDRTRFVFVLMYVSLEVLVFNLFIKNKWVYNLLDQGTQLV